MAPDAAPASLGAMPIVIVGHVDHGKSTLIGRLLHDTGSLPEERVAEVRRISQRRGLDLEWSFLLDSLQIERDQGITLDSTRVWFRTPRRRYVIIDAPGHREFLRNMISGAASAEAAVLVVDAGVGVGEQTRRHARVLELLGLKQLVVVLNKMDAVEWDRARFEALAGETGALLAELGVAAAATIPLSARHGDNVAVRSERTPWFDGPTLLEALDRFEPRPHPVDRPLRLPVQDVYRKGDDRIVVGRIESGRLSVGDSVRFAPSGTVGRVARIEAWNRSVLQRSAQAGASVALVFADDIVVERGHLGSGTADFPEHAHAAELRLVWLGSQPLEPGRRLALRVATAQYDVRVEAIERVHDAGVEAGAPGRVGRNGVATVRVRSRTPMALDAFAAHPATGRGALVEGYRVVAGVVVERAIAASSANVFPPGMSVGARERAIVHGHAGGVLWLTGLPGAGKSTLAMGAMRVLFERGRQVYVLDGDTLRQGLNRDLGFGPEDRSENIRRTAEVARLMADAGLIVIAALVSPAAADRARARQIVGAGFHEVHVRADIEVCRARDPKGLYARAAAGNVAEFTGVSAPYETPAAPDLTIDTTHAEIASSVGDLVRFAERAFAVAAKTLGR